MSSALTDVSVSNPMLAFKKTKAQPLNFLKRQNVNGTQKVYIA